MKLSMSERLQFRNLMATVPVAPRSSEDALGLALTSEDYQLAYEELALLFEKDPDAASGTIYSCLPPGSKVVSMTF